MLLIKLILLKVRPPEEVHIEGGDVMERLYFIGTYKGSDYKLYNKELICKELITSKIYFQIKLLKNLIW
jgi:hypothetical protein